MASGGSIPMFFWGQESIQTTNFVIKPSYDPFLDHAHFQAWEFWPENIKILCVSYYGMWGLYSYDSWGQESIETINFVIKQSYDPFGAMPAHFQAWEF